jgi:hypothetical protein
MDDISVDLMLPSFGKYRTVEIQRNQDLFHFRFAPADLKADPVPTLSQLHGGQTVNRLNDPVEFHQNVFTSLLLVRDLPGNSFPNCAAIGPIRVIIYLTPGALIMHPPDTPYQYGKQEKQDGHEKTAR